MYSFFHCINCDKSTKMPIEMYILGTENLRFQGYAQFSRLKRKARKILIWNVRATLICSCMLHNSLSPILLQTLTKGKFLACPLENLQNKIFFWRSVREKKMILNWTSTLISDGTLTTTKKNQPKKVNNFRVLCPLGFFSTAYVYFEEKSNFLISKTVIPWFYNWL